MITAFLAALVIGLLGGVHCIGMCGGIMGALTMGVKADQPLKRWLLIVSYSIGRIGSYVVIAIIFYRFFSSIEDYLSFSFMRWVAGLLLIAMGLYLASWWNGLLYLEKLGGGLWRFIQPVSRSLFPVKTAHHALLLGMLWGWLPCGLVYSALAYAATADSWGGAAVTMLGFGLGTLPAVVLGSVLAERLTHLLQKVFVRRLMGLLLIAFGVWTFVIGTQHMGHQGDISFQRPLYQTIG